MSPSQPDFAVFDFIWNEIIICSHDAKSACHYAPYIFHMIKHVTKLDILTNKDHLPYKPPKGKLEQLLKVGRHSTGIAPTRAQGASSSQAPPPSQAPSSSRGPSHFHGAPKSKKGTLAFIAQGLFACFNVCRSNADEIREHKKYMDEELLKIERRQKALLAKNDIPHSPVREPRDFPSPPNFYNPWEEQGQSSQGFAFGGDEEEHDFGGGEASQYYINTPEDDDDTPTDKSYEEEGDEEEEGDGDKDDGNDDE